MKGIAAVILAIILLFCSCDTMPKAEQKNRENLVAVWITYYELAAFAKSEEGFEKAICLALDKCKSIGVNTVFVHTRAFCDAIYNSEIFPRATSMVSVEGDPLEITIKAARQRGISVHAWINPYRVSSSSTDINSLPQNSPARIWRADENVNNDINVCITDNGIYLNPAEKDVQVLVLKGVRELLDNYDIDGIHIDDYFYPTANVEFDEVSYSNYKQNLTLPLDLAEWRRQNVSGLVKAIYCAVKAKDTNLLFGVSPAADIDRCYNSLYADVEAWLDGEYIDYIMPQLYFGFEYPIEKFTFDSLLTLWLDMAGDRKADLYVGLGNYKTGTASKPDNVEWGVNTDIIARQIQRLNENNIKGFAFFSYSSLFGEEDLQKKQTENIIEKLKEIK